ncbi:putative ABC transporter ATP-binding protein YbhF [compost metagenome]
MQNVIEVNKVRKQYGATVAVDLITMSVRKGEIFGIVGPNGAGKTTLIEMMVGLRVPDSGEMRVLGQDIRKHTEEIKQRIGVLLQSTSIPDKAKVKEVFSLFASFYHKSIDMREISQFLGLENKQNEYVKSLSGGWKQRVSLALALMNDPEIVFLDEPSMGLDPNARREMWDIIHRLRNEGRTVVVTTHYMEEAETLCDRVAVISSGQLIALDTPRNLVSRLGGTKRISFKNLGLTELTTFYKLPNVMNVEGDSDWIKLHTSDMDQTLKHLFHLAEGEDWIVSELRLEDASMNDVFSELTSEERRSAV